MPWPGPGTARLTTAARTLQEVPGHAGGGVSCPRRPSVRDRTYPEPTSSARTETDPGRLRATARSLTRWGHDRRVLGVRPVRHPAPGRAPHLAPDRRDQRI